MKRSRILMDSQNFPQIKIKLVKFLIFFLIFFFLIFTLNLPSVLSKWIATWASNAGWPALSKSKCCLSSALRLVKDSLNTNLIATSNIQFRIISQFKKKNN